jgi:hypothetical protein
MAKLTIASKTENRIPVKIWWPTVPPFQRASMIPQPTPEATLPTMLTIIMTPNPSTPLKGPNGTTQMAMAGKDNTKQKTSQPNFLAGDVFAESFGGAEKFFPQYGHHGAE